MRSIDIANELDYTKASVSIAMKKLRENGYFLPKKKTHFTTDELIEHWKALCLSLIHI